jgi:hypothetical protein
MSWAMLSARVAQIRRDPASEVVSVSPRRDFRPTPDTPAICASRETALIDAAATKAALIFLIYHEIVALRVEGPGKAGAPR